MLFQSAAKHASLSFSSQGRPARHTFLEAQPRLTSQGLALELRDLYWQQAMQLAGLSELMRSPGDIELLVPSDRAFVDLLHELQLSKDNFFSDLPRLRTILLGHVLIGRREFEPAPLGALLRTAGPAVLRLSDVARVRDARGREAQILGQIAPRQQLTAKARLIDRVMLTEERSLLDLLAASADHSDFFKALQQTGMATWLTATGPFTVLAPCNVAWRQQLALSEPTHGSSVQTLVARHLIAGRWLSDELPWGGQMLTLSGEALRFSPLGLIGTGPAAQALHRNADKLACNGVLHRLIQPALPESI